jgi:hypothetical protein
MERVDNDELAAFVAATLGALATGIASASGEHSIGSSNGRTSFGMPSLIKFDIAVTAKRTSQGGAGLKVQVFSIGGGVDGRHAQESETTSRISFEVPWRFESNQTVPIPSQRFSNVT